MALKAILLRKKIETKTAELEELRKLNAEFETREAELTRAIDEATAEGSELTDEDMATLDGEIDAHTAAYGEHRSKIEAIEAEIRGLQETLDAEEATPPPTVPVESKKEKNERSEFEKMDTRKKFFGMSTQERDAFFARDDVRSYLGEVRACIREKRALTNVGLTIPEVFLGLLRENIIEYSKLYKHCNVRAVGGNARLVIMGTVPEGVWTECCGNLNELSLQFNDVELNCYKVGGYFAVCNAALEDSDIDLASELLTSLGQAIGLALDKAILYGRNSSSTMRMPQGIVSRLAQTAAPSDYPATARAWVDLHTSNIITIASTATDVKLFQQLAVASGAAKSSYSRGEMVWVMNEATYTSLIANALSINAAGAIVTGVQGTMPVIGGVIEVLNFLPDNVIVGGYFDLYDLAERGGSQFASSEHVMFLADQTVFKGTARYDGVPAIAEAFVVIGINGATPTATMAFAPDTANSADSETDDGE